MAAQNKDVDDLKITETTEGGTGKSPEALKENNESEECTLNTVSVGQSSQNRFKEDSQSVTLDATTVSSSQLSSDKEGVQGIVTDLRRYSRACKEKEDTTDNKLHNLNKTLTKATSQSPSERLNEKASKDTLHKTGHVDEQKLQRKSKNTFEGIKLDALSNEENMESGLKSRPVRREKIQAQQKISSRFKTGRGRGRGFIQHHGIQKTPRATGSSISNGDEKSSMPSRLPSNYRGLKRKYKRKSWWKDKRQGLKRGTRRDNGRNEPAGEDVVSSIDSGQGSVSSSKAELVTSSRHSPSQVSSESDSEQTDDSESDNFSIVKSQLSSGMGDMTGQMLSLHGADLLASSDMKLANTLSSESQFVVDVDYPNDASNLSSMHPVEHHTNNTGTSVDASNLSISADNYYSRGRRRGKSKSQIKCEFCGRTFIHRSAYIIHRRVHTGEKPHICHVCGRGFAQRSNLTAHTRTHLGNHDMICCGITFARLSSFRHHRKTHKIENNGDWKCCPICDKKFPYQSLLDGHMRIHSGRKPFTCKVCVKSFSTQNALRTHEKIHWPVKPYVCPKCGQGYSQISTLRRTHVCKVQTEQPMDVDVAYRCQFCHKCFKNKRQYDVHVESHNEKQRYPCSLCGEKFDLECELETHIFYCKQMNAHLRPQSPPFYMRSPSPPRLSTLPKPFIVQRSCSPESSLPKMPGRTLKSLLHTNVKTTVAKPKHRFRQSTANGTPTTSGKRWSLLACPFHFTSESVKNNSAYPESPSAVSHIIIRLNKLDQKPDPRKYFCPRCGRLFRHVMKLRAHMLTHSRGECYTCGDCGKKMESWRTFWRHQRVHRQKKGRFFCPSCCQGFRFASSYQSHLREHPELNSFICPRCPKSFSNTEQLRAHQRDVHKEMIPYICDVCDKTFSCQLKLEIHSVTHQPVDHVGERCLKQKETVEKRGVRPYQCAKCDLTFRTVDQLFQHQLCHSVLEDKLAWQTGSQQQLDTCQSTSIRDSDLEKHSKFETTSSRTNSASPPQHPVVSQNSHSSRPRSSPDLHTSPKQVPSEPFPLYSAQRTLSTPPGTASLNTQLSQNGNLPREHASVVDEHSGSSCADCGAVFSGVSELFEHYLSHARGEV